MRTAKELETLLRLRNAEAPHVRQKGVEWVAQQLILEAQHREKVPDFRRVLEGKIAYVMMVDRAKGQKLKAAFDAVLS